MNIRHLRLNIGITQQELAEKIGVTQQAVFKWENDISFPSADKLPDLAKTLNCTIEELYG